LKTFKKYDKTNQTMLYVQRQTSARSATKHFIFFWCGFSTICSTVLRHPICTHRTCCVTFISIHLCWLYNVPAVINRLAISIFHTHISSLINDEIVFFLVSYMICILCFLFNNKTIKCYWWYVIVSKVQPNRFITDQVMAILNCWPPSWLPFGI